MKTKALLILMAALANQAISQTTFTNIVLPGNWPSTNFWWEASPPPISIVSSQAWAAVNENFRRASNAFRGVNSGASLSGTNTWTGTNDYSAGKLTIGGVPVYAGVTNGGGGSGGGSNGPLVIAVAPSRIRSDESLTLKVTGSGFQSGGMYMSVGGYSQGGTYVSATEIDVDWTGGIYSDGSYDVKYTAANGSHTLIGGLTIGPSTAELAGYATNAGSAGGISLANKDVLFVSDRTVAFATNFYNMAGKGVEPFNTGLYLTNGFAGAEYELFGDGVASVVRSEDGYTGWSRDTTNVPVYIGVVTDIGSMGDAFGLSNLVIYTWTQPAVFHRTNSAYSQFLFVDKPKYPQQVARLSTAKNEAFKAVRDQTNWSSIPAQREVDVNGHTIRYAPEWEGALKQTLSEDSISFQWAGSNVWTLTAPPSVSMPWNYTVIMYDWATRITSSVPHQVGFDCPGVTNVVYSPSNIALCLPPATYTGSPPRVLYSEAVQPIKWTEMTLASSWPTTRSFIITRTNWNYDPNNGPLWPDPAAITSYEFSTNTGIIVSFTRPNNNQGVFKVVTNAVVPFVGRISGVLSMPPLTVASATATTWGNGAGLLCADTNYVYVSVGTNRWKRAALTTW